MKGNFNKYAYLYVINTCNQKCYSCCNQHWMKQFDGKVFTPEKLLSLNLSKYDNIFLTGGEPGLLNKSNKDLITDYLFNTCPNSQIEVFTNGTNIKDWQDRIHKLIHIVDFDNVNNIIRSPNCRYSIVITNKLDLNKVKKIISTISNDGYRIDIKNDSMNPLNEVIFNDILEQLGISPNKEKNRHVQYKDNLKIEKVTGSCSKLPCDDTIFHSMISIYKKCLCNWYCCLS